jgi:predicted DsbA family dithiol-disulfide isomerase
MIKEKEKEEVEIIEEEKPKKDKKAQNYLAALILLAGLLLGSVFVDIAQLIQGQGISQKRLADKDLFEYNGKTWVAYSDPVIPLTIVNDKECEECSAENAILGLKAAIPTLVPTEIDMNSDKGKEILAKINVKMIPAFVFTKEIEQSEVYERIQNILSQKDDLYILDSAMLGISGKYVETPSFDSQDKSVLGNPNAKISVIVFSDFQCPYSKLFYESLDEVVKDNNYKDKIKVSFKHLPLSFHQRANDAALASECADEQDKFWEMYDIIFQKQEEWQGDTDGARFKQYARTLGLDTTKFNQCVDGKKFQSEIDSDKKQAQDFNISGTPAIFINNDFVSGAIGADDFKKRIDQIK